MALNMQVKDNFSKKVHISHIISSDMPSKIPNTKDGNTKERKMTYIYVFCTMSNKALPLHFIYNRKSWKNDSRKFGEPA